jgi:pimeloyl-ACP methyl ester carboxylesterase
MAPASIVLLPGMMLTASLYAHQVCALSGGYSITVPGLTSSSTVAALAADVLRDAPQRFALVGLSMGGIVAFEIWRQASERVTHLALLDTTPYPDAADRQALRNTHISEVSQGGLREVLTHAMKPMYLAPKHREDAGLRESVLAMGLTLGPAVFGRQSLALRDRPGSLATLPTINCPTLVLCGRDDQLCPADCHIMMAQRIPRADLVMLAECGHLSPLEQPEAVSDALRHLLQRNS